MSATSAAQRMLAKYGQLMTLTRTGESDLPLKGKRYGSGTEDLDNGAVQQVFKVKIAPTELLASSWAVKEPRRGDRLMVDSRLRTVRDAVPLREGEVVALYDLEVAG